MKVCTQARTNYARENQRKEHIMADDTQSRTPGPNKLPKRYLQFQKRYPRVFQAYDALGAATAEAGPWFDKRRGPGKMAIAAGAQMGGAVHRHTRRAVGAGCWAQEIY